MGGRAIAVPCDVTDEAAVKTTVRTVVERLGALDVAVANAGVGVNGSFEALTEADWRRQFEVNLFGVVHTARHALPALHQRGGRLALVGSAASMVCVPGTSAYVASKFAVRAIGLTLSQELFGTGVSCTTVHPGFVATDLSRVDNEGHFDPARTDPRPRVLMWSPEEAAIPIARAIHDRRIELVFTGHGKVGAWLGRHAPGIVYLGMTRFRTATSRGWVARKQWPAGSAEPISRRAR